MRFLAAAILAIASMGCAHAAEPIITTFAGGGTGPAIGDGGPATQAVLTGPVALAVDAAGNVYVADSGFAARVRRIDAVTGIITTVAGNGQPDNTGATKENVAATSVAVSANALAFDAAGNLYLSSYSRVRKVTPAGIITTVAGTGVGGFSGDGGKATVAKIGKVVSIAFDRQGAMYLADGNYRIRKVDLNGNISTIAGTGAFAYPPIGNGGPAIAATVTPDDIAFDRYGNLLVIDDKAQIRRIGKDDGIIRAVAPRDARDGYVFRNDPIAWQSDQLLPSAIAVDAANNLLVANYANFVRIIGADGAQATLAGVFNDSTFEPFGASRGFGGDGGPASQALFNDLVDIAIDPSGNVYVLDQSNNRIRKITPGYAAPHKPAGVDAFATYWRMDLGTWVASAAIADIDGDRRLDVVLRTESWATPGIEPTQPNDNKLLWFQQGADGRLVYRQSVALPEPRTFSDGPIATDLDHDGNADLLVVTNYGIAVYRGTIAGIASQSTTWTGFPNATVPNGVAAADMDRDGHMDVVAFLYGDPEGGSSPFYRWAIAVFHGDGKGGYSSKGEFPYQASGRPRVRDVNHDGWPDIVSMFQDVGQANGIAQYDSGLRIFLNDGTGGLRPPFEVRTGRPYFRDDLAIGDFDGDGLLDFYVARDANSNGLSGGEFGAEYAHFRELPGGAIVYDGSRRAFDSPTNMEVGDFNNDGMDDIVVLHDGWESIGLMQQAFRADGSRFLDEEVKYWIGSRNMPSDYAMDTGDINSDGCRDVALADSVFNFEVLYGTCRHVVEGAKPKRPPQVRRKSAPLLPGQMDDATVDASPASTVDAVWAASQKVARMAWQSTMGTVRAMLASPVPWPLALGWTATQR
ncbi:hypothetical protein LYSHEL_02560 [Lysobacter helvus]|uniref:Teneurin NHL domain-containing protein n=2 Tax=Lysobacteraceae TaxID=32033 RepID=A0ABM7Q1W5_9GAMM|nr:MULTISPECIES: FG-GAP-like repeat-containing protein [Lysobacter]BCT91232.1 hypothetical protein LYSCAS_02560 [Lysobacter caseinilyticus]BCT94385.1 hypothetical protein LYSHEL_02560 [Lysobacter helvus]